MKKQGIVLTIFASAALLLSGCSNNAQTGAVIGSLVGAGIGKSTANHRDKRAAIGAVVGGLVGAAVGQEQDRKYSSRSYNNGSVASTSPYYGGSSSHSHGSNKVQHPAVSHKHGNRTHTHPGGSGKHAHNTGSANQNTAQHSHSHNTNQREVVYVERPYYPVSTSVVIGSGYHYYPRRHYRHYPRHYRNKHRYRHHNRHHHRNRHHNRVNYNKHKQRVRHHNKHKFRY